MIRTAFKSAIVITGLVLLGSSVLHADSFGPSSDRKHGPSRRSVEAYATGLTNPRGLTFGPDGKLDVAEAGTGGSLTPTGGPGCPINVNVFSPYTAGYSGRVTRVRRDGTKETVADNLPSMTDNSGASYGPTDVAFIGQTLYVLIEMGGCSHALPDDLPAILRINRDGSTTNVANLNQGRDESAALHQGHQPGDHRPGAGRRVPLHDRDRQVPLRGRDQPRLPAACGSADARSRRCTT